MEFWKGYSDDGKDCNGSEETRPEAGTPVRRLSLMQVRK